MKTLRYFSILFLLFLAACNGKTSALLEETHDNGKVKITVKGERLTSVEPWKVNLTVKAYNFKEGSLIFEIYAEDLNAETVSFNWLDETNCQIIFTQQDGVKRTFHLIASPNQMQMAEVPAGS
jgi:hypothetical protein